MAKFYLLELGVLTVVLLSLLVKQKAYVAIPSLAIHKFSKVIRRKGVPEGSYLIQVKEFEH